MSSFIARYQHTVSIDDVPRSGRKGKLFAEDMNFIDEK